MRGKNVLHTGSSFAASLSSQIFMTKTLILQPKAGQRPGHIAPPPASPPIQTAARRQRKADIAARPCEAVDMLAQEIAAPRPPPFSPAISTFCTGYAFAAPMAAPEKDWT